VKTLAGDEVRMSAGFDCLFEFERSSPGAVKKNVFLLKTNTIG